MTERVRQKKDSGTEKVNKDFLDVMLEYEGDGKEGPDKISESNVTIIIMVITSSIPICVFVIQLDIFLKNEAIQSV